ncbi:MAG: hypothetical protein MZV70_56790 [Desulfobacterales bacterium]|nr:hypothetical protein [Desulfobacterales bacterium]
MDKRLEKSREVLQPARRRPEEGGRARAERPRQGPGRRLEEGRPARSVAPDRRGAGEATRSGSC